ncbi:MAG: hypothetical protein LBG06_08395, partial [Deltaproteobacteria bacterium]|nr:hypothetical protein [Deltaproteobacteria bacterium]
MASLKRLFDGWRPTAVTSVYFAALLSMLFNPVAFQYLIGVRGFDRVFGNATMGSVALREFASAAPPFGAVDPSLLIRLFTIYCLLVLPLCFLAGVACCRWITAGAGRAAGGDCDRQAALSFLGAVSLNALALTAVAVFNKYNLLDLQPVLAGYALQSVPLAIVLATLFYLRRPFLPFAHFRLAVYSSLSAALFVSFLLPPTPLGFVAVFRFAAAFAILLPAVLAALRHAGPESVGGLLPPLAVSCFGLLLAGLSLEACNVLNQRGVYIIDRRLFATGVYAAAIALSIGLAIRARVAGRAPGPAAAPGQGTGTGSQTEPSSGPAPGKASEPVTGPGSGPVTGPEPAPAAGAAPEQVTGPCPDPDAGTAPGAGRGKVWDTVAVAGLLLSLFYFTALPPLQISAGTELFEQ